MHAVLEIWADLVRDVDSIGLAMTRVSPEREREIGNAMAAWIVSGHILRDGAAKAYLSDVGDGLVRAMGPQPLHYTFDILDDPSLVNAVALPGGHIYITTGLLNALQSEAELAAILGHEISHVSLKHAIGRIQYELALSRVAGDDIAGLLRATYRVLSTGYSRQQETEADGNGVLIAAAAGYDPRAALENFRLLSHSIPDPADSQKTLGGETIGSILETIGDYAKTHPASPQRIADVESTNPQQRCAVGRHEVLRRRAQLSGKAKPVHFRTRK